MKPFTTCLWFDTQDEDAANLYTSVFPDAEILGVSRWGEGGAKPAGTAMTVDFIANGQRFLALNGSPGDQFNRAISFQVFCEDQAKIDRYWDALTDGGSEGRCGWLEDRFGLSWQVVPSGLSAFLGDPDPARAKRAMAAMMAMGKFEIAGLQQAADGAGSA